jgi:hypothetical protein
MVKFELIDKLNQEQKQNFLETLFLPAQVRRNVCFFWGKAPTDNFMLISTFKLDL